MSNKAIPEIVCKACHKLQPWRNQKECMHCGIRLSNWHVFVQLHAPFDKRAS